MPQIKFGSPHILSIAACCLTQHVFFCIVMTATMTTKKEKEQRLPQFVLSLTTTLRCTQVQLQDQCPNYGCLSQAVAKYTPMIRKNSLFCKLFRINISSVALFELLFTLQCHLDKNKSKAILNLMEHDLYFQPYFFPISRMPINFQV